MPKVNGLLQTISQFGVESDISCIYYLEIAGEEIEFDGGVKVYYRSKPHQKKDQRVI